MSDDFVPIQAKVWESLNLATPDEDQPSPFFNGKVGHLVYDLSSFEEEDGVLRRQPTPVDVTTGPTSNRPDSRDVEKATAGPVTGTDTEAFVSAASDEVKKIDGLLFIVRNDGDDGQDNIGQAKLRYDDGGALGPISAFRYNFQSDGADDERYFQPFETPLLVSPGQDTSIRLETYVQATGGGMILDAIATVSTYNV